ncbi:MAG: hypothetical protein HQK55_05140 [Deltaproteobacteria bacterium]|nr:hypothetical protein [Deltaproteobacteria bacterium]
MATRLLKDLAFARSGDKGNISNICLYARDPKDYELLKKQVTAERVKEHFQSLVLGEVLRYEVESLQGFNFVMKEALDGGATQSLRLDTLGKTMASALLRMEIENQEGTTDENK